MRVDLDGDRTIASITLPDTKPKAIAIHLAGDTADTIETEEQSAFLATGGVEHFAWRPGAKLPTQGTATPAFNPLPTVDQSLVHLPPFFEAAQPGTAKVH